VSARPRCIVVVGAGTNVGKTHVACALASALVRRGEPVTAKKPIESGYEAEGSDAARLAAAAGHPLIAPRYALAEPVSPHRAARHEGLSLEKVELVRFCASATDTLVETAGGLLSPLSPSLTNLDLTVALAPTRVVLVAANRLGALHDVRACQLALAARALTAFVVLSAPPVADEATHHNGAELALLGWAPRVFEFPRAEAHSPATLAAADALAAAL